MCINIINPWFIHLIWEQSIKSAFWNYVPVIILIVYFKEKMIPLLPKSYQEQDVYLGTFSKNNWG